MDSKKVGERLGYPLIISQLFTRDSHQNKALCWTELLSAGGGRQKLSVFLTSLNLIGYWGIGWGGGGSSISSGHSYFSTVYPDTTPYVICIRLGSRILTINSFGHFQWRIVIFGSRIKRIFIWNGSRKIQGQNLFTGQHKKQLPWALALFKTIFLPRKTCLRNI